jgi:hypothetical protein
MRFVDWYQKSPDRWSWDTRWIHNPKTRKGFSFVFFCGFCFYVSNSINLSKKQMTHWNVSEIFQRLETYWKDDEDTTILLPRYLKKNWKKTPWLLLLGGVNTRNAVGTGSLVSSKGEGGEKENGKDVLLLFFFCFVFVTSFLIFSFINL